MIRIIYYPILIALVLYNYSKRKDVFHPVFVTGVIWVVFPLLYDIVTIFYKGYHVLSDIFFVAVFSYVILYSLIFAVAYTKTSLTRVTIKRSPLSLLSINVLMGITILINAMYIVGIVRLCGTYSLVDVMSSYRIITLARAEIIPTYLKLLDYARAITVPLTCYLIISKKEFNKGMKICVLVFFFLIPVIIGSKAEMLKRTILFICCYVTSRKHHKLLVLSAIVASVALLLYVISGRDSIEVSTSNNRFLDYTFAYFFSSLPAFDMVLNKELIVSSLFPGERTFYFMFLFLSKMGLCNSPTDYKFMYLIPSPKGGITTNVFTGIGPYYIDFGVWGIIVYALLLGVLTGFTYKKFKESSSAFYFILHFIILYGVVFQFFGDLIFTYIITTILDIISLVVVIRAAKIFTLDDLKNEVLIRKVNQ